MTLDDLKKELEDFPELCLTTPTVCMKGVWKPGKSSSYYPCSDPETQVQIRLTSYLKGWLKKTARVKLEDALDIGRVDICILTKPHPNEDDGLKYWAIIELKVIKDFRYSEKPDKPNPVTRSDNINTLIDGITQADAYAKETMLRTGFCEVIDMRKKKEENLDEDTKVQSVLKQCKKNISLKIRPIYGDPDHAQKAGFEI